MTEPTQQIDSLETAHSRDEAGLVAAAKRDPGAFEPLYLRYVQPIYRYLYSRIGRQAEAEDATAQTFLAALEALDRYHHDGHFVAWLFTIARCKAVDHFRAQGRQAPLEDADGIPGGADLLQSVVQTERKAALAALIAALPEDERELIRLRYVAELSFAEIGHLLGCSADAAKKSLYRLLARLQSQLEVYHD
ncbi:MAG TPA: RNA polymerase sigma factor [Longilinea sp.]|nr:RNA polymerase sigma factor [Longilinea sp.]